MDRASSTPRPRLAGYTDAPAAALGPQPSPALPRSMNDLIRDFFAFLKDYWWVWIGVMVVTIAVLVWVAKSGGQPDAPFQYRF